MYTINYISYISTFNKFFIVWYSNLNKKLQSTMLMIIIDYIAH